VEGHNRIRCFLGPYVQTIRGRQRRDVLGGVSPNQAMRDTGTGGVGLLREGGRPLLCAIELLAAQRSEGGGGAHRSP
jgi:hypothetical protein